MLISGNIMDAQLGIMDTGISLLFRRSKITKFNSRIIYSLFDPHLQVNKANEVPIISRHSNGSKTFTKNRKKIKYIFMIILGQA